VIHTAAEICKRAVVAPAAISALAKTLNGETLSHEETLVLCDELAKRLAFAHKRNEFVEKALARAKVPTDMVLDGMPCMSASSRIDVMALLANRGHRFPEPTMSEREAEVVKHMGYHICPNPHCDDDTGVGLIEQGYQFPLDFSGRLLVPIKCSNCGYTWTAIYRFSHVVEPTDTVGNVLEDENACSL